MDDYSINRRFVRAWLAANGMTQAEFCNQAGITNRTLSKLLLGQGCTVKTAGRISQVMGIGIGDLLNHGKVLVMLEKQDGSQKAI